MKKLIKSAGTFLSGDLHPKTQSTVEARAKEDADKLFGDVGKVYDDGVRDELFRHIGIYDLSPPKIISKSQLTGAPTKDEPPVNKDFEPER